MQMRKYQRSKFFCFFTGLILSGYVSMAQPDIGVTTIINPSIPFCPGTDSVSVELNNFGTDTVFTATIHWSVNAIAQPDYNFNDTLDPSEKQKVVIGAYTFNGKTTYKIDASSSNPNGVPDVDTTNDLHISNDLLSMMAGNYSVGIISDYATFSEAVDALVTRNICGSVTFNVNPGIFSEQISIPEITGSSPTSIVTFQSSTADSFSVLLQHPSSTSDSSNFTLQLTGADYIEFRLMTIERTDTQLYGRAVEITGQAEHNTFTNMRLVGTQSSISGNQSAVVFGGADPDFPDFGNSFLNSVFINGSFGIYLSPGNVPSVITNTAVQDNQFIDQLDGGIYLSNQGSSIVTNNTVSSSLGNSQYVALAFDSCANGLSILKNNISDIPGSGIALTGCQALPFDRSQIANNFVYATGFSGIAVSDGSYTDIVYNSINQVSTDTLYRALYISGTGTSLAVLDNLLINSGVGYSYVIDDSVSSGVSVSDYNDIYTNGNFVGRFGSTDILTLNHWSDATTFDSASVSIDPGYVSNNDLHASSVSISGAGMPFPGITDDIDGDVRNSIAPDIGADEFAGPFRDLGVVVLVSPSDTACGDSLQMISVVVENFGSVAETNFLVNIDISGAATYNLSQIFNDTLAPISSGLMTFFQTVNTTGGGTFTIKAYTDLFSDGDHSNDTLNRIITVLPYPSPPAVSDTFICGADSITLTAPGSNVYWYDSLAGGSLITAGNDFTVYVDSIHTFYVQEGDLCPSLRVPLQVSVFPVPSLNLGNDTVIVAPQTIALTADSGFVSYSWSNGDTAQSIVVDSTGEYIVAAMDTNGCIASDTIEVTVLTGLNPPLHGELSVYYNPESGVVTIHQVLAVKSHLEIIDMLGRSIYRSVIQVHDFILDLNMQPKGIYLVRILNQNVSYSKRIVKE